MWEQPPSGVMTSATQNSSLKSGVASERSNPEGVPPSENANTRPSGSRPTRYTSALAVVQSTPAHVNDMDSSPKPSGRSTSVPGSCAVTNEKEPSAVASPKSGSASDPTTENATETLTGSAADEGGNAKAANVRKAAVTRTGSLLILGPGEGG